MPVDILRNNGPLLTSKLAELLVVEKDISKSTARKQIERAAKEDHIRLLADLRFAHNSTFAYLPEQYGRKEFNQSLFTAMEEAKSGLRLPLAAIRARGGIIPEWIFPSVSGLPSNEKNKRHSDALKSKLLSANLLELKNGCLQFGTNDVITTPALNGRLAAELALLRGFGDWLQGQRLIGSQISLRSELEPPQFGFYQWDLVAPTYVAPLATRSTKATPGFIVADIMLGRQIQRNEVQFFIEKCANIRAHRNNRPFIAFLIADWFEQDALNLAQSKGVIFTTPKTLFGRKFSEALEDMRKTLEEKEFELEAQAKKLSKFLEVTEELDTMRSLHDNLRGQLFEVIVGHCYAKEKPGTVLHGRHFPDFKDGKKKLDCDVLQTAFNEYLRGCECKGYRGTTKVTVADVKKWYEETVPAIRKYFGTEDYPNQDFSFWTSGEFDEDAKAWLDKFAGKCKSYAVTYFSGSECEKKILKYGDPTIKDAYSRWFKPRMERRPRKSKEEYEQSLLDKNIDEKI